MENELENNDELETLRAELATLKAERAETPVEPAKEAVKENINRAYKERDEMAMKVKELEEAKRQSELKALEDAGRKDEADKMRMKEMERQLDESRKEVVGLTRDNTLRTVLAGMDFVSDKAADVAYNDIVGRLVQDTYGNWVSSTGQPISEFATQYSQDESNKFLFRVKQSSGSVAMQTHSTSAPVNQTKPLKEMSEEEVLKYYATKPDDGKLWI